MHQCVNREHVPIPSERNVLSRLSGQRPAPSLEASQRLEKRTKPAHIVDGNGHSAQASMSSVNEIRSAFLNYFAKNGHDIVPESRRGC